MVALEVAYPVGERQVAYLVEVLEVACPVGEQGVVLEVTHQYPYFAKLV